MRPSWPGFGLRPGDVHFSQDHCQPPPPPILHPAALQWFERTEMASFQQTKTKETKPSFETKKYPNLKGSILPFALHELHSHHPTLSTL